MHKYIEYISDLLFLHDCVIVPGFGGFICNSRSAHIDKTDGRIYPPSKDIMFNRQLTANDGLLAHWIARRDHIPYEKACSRLALFSEELKIRLNRREVIPFGKIGSFRTDRRSNILFTPSANNFHAEAFGMDRLALPEGGTAGFHTNGNARLDVPAHNLMHRLMKYALAVACLAGVIFIIRQDPSDRIHNRTSVRSNLATLHPGLTDGQIRCNSVISPEEDYINYDPLSALTE